MRRYGRYSKKQRKELKLKKLEVLFKIAFWFSLGLLIGKII